MLSESTLQFWEFLSYLVTVLALPMALYAFWRESRAERDNELKEIQQREDEIYIQLSQQYSAFLESILANTELGLLDERPEDAPPLTATQQQKKIVYYEMLIALFERAYILLYEDAPSKDASRRWGTWADYISWWLEKPDFRAYARTTLEGEDPEFAAFLQARMDAAALTAGPLA
jgi:hypothetical protein